MGTSRHQGLIDLVRRSRLCSSAAEPRETRQRFALHVVRLHAAPFTVTSSPAIGPVTVKTSISDCRATSSSRSSRTNTGTRDDPDLGDENAGAGAFDAVAHRHPDDQQEQDVEQLEFPFLGKAEDHSQRDQQRVATGISATVANAPAAQHKEREWSNQQHAFDNLRSMALAAAAIIPLPGKSGCTIISPT